MVPPGSSFLLGRSPVPHSLSPSVFLFTSLSLSLAGEEGVLTLKSIKLVCTLRSVPHSFSQSVSMRDYYINSVPFLFSPIAILFMPAMQCFQNSLPYFAIAISYECKMFLESTLVVSGINILQVNLWPLRNKLWHDSLHACSKEVLSKCISLFC
jgi:hypothetical protein